MAARSEMLRADVADAFQAVRIFAPISATTQLRDPKRIHVERLTAAGQPDCRYMSNAQRVAHGFKPKHRPGTTRRKQTPISSMSNGVHDLPIEHIEHLRRGIDEFRTMLNLKSRQLPP